MLASSSPPTSRSTPTSAGSSTATTRRWATCRRRSCAPSFSRPPLDQILAYREHVDTAHQPPARNTTARRRGAAPHRAGAGARAAAPGTRRHRHQACVLHQPSASGVLPPLTRRASDAQHTIAPPLDWVSYRPGSQDPGVVEVGVTPDPAAIEASPSTTRRPATRSISRPSAWPRASSPAPSTSRSSTKTATAAPSSGSPKAGTPCVPKAGRRRSTGVATRHALRLERLHPARLPAARASSPRRRSATSASLRPTPLRAGPVIGCHRVRVGVRRDATAIPRATANLLESRRLHPQPGSATADTAAADLRRRLGVDRSRPTPAIPATSRCPAHWASTTASS